MEILLVVNESSNSVSMIDTSTFKIIDELKVGGQPQEIVVSPDGRYALVSNFGGNNEASYGRTLTVINLISRSIFGTVLLPIRSRPHGIKFISNNFALVTAQGIQSLLLVNIMTFNIIGVIPLPGVGCNSVTSDSKRRFAYIGNLESGTVCKVNITSLKLVSEIKVGTSVECVTLTSTDSLLLATSGKDNKFVVIDPNSMVILRTVRTDKRPVRISLFNNDKSAIIINGISGTAQIIDINTMVIIRTFNTNNSTSSKYKTLMGSFTGYPLDIIIRKDNRTAFISNFYAGNVSLVNLETGEIIKTVEDAAGPSGMDISIV